MSIRNKLRTSSLTMEPKDYYYYYYYYSEGSCEYIK